MNNIIIRKSPLVLVKNIVVFQTFFTTFVALLTLYLSETDTVILGSDWSFLLAVIILGVGILVFLFLRWYLTAYIIANESITMKSGLLRRNRHVVKKQSGHRYEITESIFGRFLKYKNVKIFFGDNYVLLKSISSESLELVIENLEPKREKLGLDELKQYSLEELISFGESSQLEYKSTLRYDLKLKELNRDLEEAVIKNIAAFLNTTGGVLLIGVDDKGNIRGLEDDYQSLPKQNSDGLENHLNQLIKKYLGSEILQFIDITFENHKKHDVCRINITSAPDPVYTRFKETEHFFIRTGNSVTSLEVSEAVKYFNNNFTKKL